MEKESLVVPAAGPVPALCDLGPTRGDLVCRKQSEVGEGKRWVSAVPTVILGLAVAPF